jgi:dTDP-3-amino-3,4,6-trideoxy-alpha-D-glucose transaminase
MTPLSTPAGTASVPVPVMKLSNNSPALFDEMMGAVARVAAAGAFTLGHEVEAFEAEFAAYNETEHCIGVSSGTEALVLALRALGIGPGDEVIVPGNSFIATAEAVTLVGAFPRLVDVDPHTGCLTADVVERHLGPRVRCVIPVHLYGRTVEMDPLLAVCRAAGVAVVEDACQAHGARYHGRRVGTLGDLGCFSFYPTKNLGAWGDAGAVVTADPTLAGSLRMLRSHGEGEQRNRHRIVGTTGRLDALQAAVLRVKLTHLDRWNDERRHAAAALTEALAGCREIETPAPLGAGHDHVFHLYVVTTPQRDELRAELGEHGIASAIHYPTPIHLTEAYADLEMGHGSLPVAERLAGRIVSLPMFPGMTELEIQRVARAVHELAGTRELSA